jgi:hypothetical protein
MVADSFQGGAIESVSDFTTYVQTRAAQGFNTIQMDLIATNYVRSYGNSATYATNDGIVPFTGAKVTTPNPTYFARMDQFVSILAQYNMVAFLNPYETGPSGGMPDLVAAGATACNTYGQYVGNRYKNSPNVMWHFGNDYEGGANDTYVLALINGVKTAAPNQLRGGQLCFAFGDNNPCTSFDNPSFRPPIQTLAGVYTYGPTYQTCITAYNPPSVTFVAGYPGTNSTPPCPVIMTEATYEFQQNLGTYDAGTALTLRRIAWWAYLGGAVGYIYGCDYTWGGLKSGWLKRLLKREWQNNLSSPGALDLGRLATFFNGISWQNLVPDQTHVVATAGYGAPSINNPFASNTYVPLSATADGTCAVAYFSRGSASSLTVNLATFTGQVTAKWFDPTNAIYTTIGTFTNSGAQVFTPSGNNSTGDPDWVLLLTS